MNRRRFQSSLFYAALVFGLYLLARATGDAAVTRVEVSGRRDLASGYEEIDGRLYFEIDPRLARNAVIADVGLAPVDAAGQVSFSADLRILKPKDAARSNGAAWVEIPNRGGEVGLSPWIVQGGFTVLNVGWEFDVPRVPGKLRAEVPVARNPDGSAIRGVVSAIFTPDRPAEEQTLTDLEDYPPVDAGGPDSRLTVRSRAAFPGGRELPRAAWSLEGKRLHLKGGFEAGKTYEVAYLAEAPPVAGLGYAAIRDAAAWLKNAPDSLAPVKHAYAFGTSQCGRFLRDYLYLGFNTDEQERPVLDGVIANVAGAGRLVLNQRWATPRSQAPFYTASCPFADSAQTDPVSGHVDGVLENPRVKNPPKVFYLNTDCEYWGGGRVAALTHTDPAGTKDLEFPANVRSYFFAGTQHGAAKFPPTAQVEGAPLANPVNPAPVAVALRLALHRWVTEGIEPPPSVYPKLADGTLVPVARVRFPAVPGMGAPGTIRSGLRLPNPLWPDGVGAGTELPLLVPQVDTDGNDLAGIRLPDVAVPLATATGWVFRPAALGSPQELVMLRGAWVPFALTKAGRLAAHDPRPSIEERYDSKDTYLAKVKTVLQRLVEQRFLSDTDLAPLLQQAGERWDWVTRQTAR
jgi:hypothetical protein